MFLDGGRSDGLQGIGHHCDPIERMLGYLKVGGVTELWRATNDSGAIHPVGDRIFVSLIQRDRFVGAANML